MWPLCTVALLLGVARADDEKGEPSTPDVAEYNRISQEIEKLATRNAWAGVERLWLELASTGVEPSFDDCVSGAHSARAIGDVHASRARLDRAHRIREEREIVDWMSEIDENYGSVELLCDLGRKPAELRIEAMPFMPQHRIAIEFAQKQVVEHCDFDGLLPRGDYEFVEGGGDRVATVSVKPRVSTMKVDFRKSDRKRKK